MFGFFKRQPKRDKLSEDIEKAVIAHQATAKRQEVSNDNLDNALRALANVRQDNNG